MPEDKITVSQALDAIYADVDPQVEKHAKAQGVTCRKGCSHCCTLLAIITIADGVYIADHLLEQENWREWIPKLVATSKEFCYVGISSPDWFRKQVPCVFLKDNICSVYSKRPSACRYHMAVSPPENCADAVNPETRILDLIHVEAETSWRVSAEMNPGMPLTAPIPLMTLYAMALLAQQKYKDRVGEIYEAAKILPTPAQWLVMYGEKIIQAGEEQFDKMKEQGRIL